MELFEFAAKVKTDLDPEERSRHVENMITMLGLQGCKNTPCGGPLVAGMSGGERKRTSIGYELMASPRLVILDEPTSGLDSHCALKVMTHLKRLAVKKNITVICSLHQAQSQIMEMCDQV